MNTNQPVRLLLIRHGHAVANSQNKAALTTCSGLTALGRSQVTQLATLLQKSYLSRWELPVRMFVSPVMRARETANLLVVHLKTVVPINQITIVEELAEVDPGSADGQQWAKIIAARGASPWASPNRPVAPNGESMVTALRRQAKALSAIAMQSVEAVSIVVGHGNLALASLVAFADLAPKTIMQFDVQQSYASITYWEEFPARASTDSSRKPRMSLRALHSNDTGPLPSQ